MSEAGWLTTKTQPLSALRQLQVDIHLSPHVALSSMRATERARASTQIKCTARIATMHCWRANYANNTRSKVWYYGHAGRRKMTCSRQARPLLARAGFGVFCGPGHRLDHFARVRGLAQLAQRAETLAFLHLVATAK